MRRILLLSVVLAASRGTVQAQTAPPMGSYAELNAGATLGHKGDSSISGEAAAQLTERWQLFGEVGRMGNVATSTIDGRAQAIANLMGGSVTTVQRALYADGGLRFQPTPIDRWHPYALVGLGVAGVKTNATFFLNGTVVSAPQLLTLYGVQPGTDLSSNVRRLLLMGGGGVHVAFGSRYLVDISYRYGYIFPQTNEIVGDTGIQTQRFQTGLGMRF
jgi:opacity protein-like surface antigen